MMIDNKAAAIGWSRGRDLAWTVFDVLWTTVLLSPLLDQQDLVCIITK
jgi:hypothetical protein